MKIHRFRPQGIIPLELWDLELGDGLLYEQPERLPEALEALREGRATTRWSRTPLWAARDFDGLFVGGGRPFTPAVESPYPIEVSPDGAFVGERGGIELLRAAGRTSGLIVDVGQSAIKVTSWGKETLRQTLPRDAASLPIRAPDIVEREVAEQRRRARTFLAKALRGGTDIVLALPCEIDAHGTPGRSSYIGWEGDSRLVADAVRLSGSGKAEVWLLQDSELAGLSCPAMGNRTLVLTLGYAVGGAVKLSP
jgi:hypothetical protein